MTGTMTATQYAYVGWVKIQVPPHLGILRCEICKQDIGTFDPKDLKAPLHAAMFKPVGPGFPYPFRVDPRLTMLGEWDNLRCPYCKYRPFLDKDALMTPAGRMKVGDRVPHHLSPAEKAAIERQKTIDREWTVETEIDPETVTSDQLRELYPDYSQDKINQLMINMKFPREKMLDIVEESPQKKGKKKYQCDFCGQKFRHAPSLSRHKRKCQNKPKEK